MDKYTSSRLFNTGIPITVLGRSLEIWGAPRAAVCLVAAPYRIIYTIRQNPATHIWEMVTPGEGDEEIAYFQIHLLDRTQFLVTPSLPGSFELSRDRQSIEYRFEQAGDLGWKWESYPSLLPFACDEVNIALVIAQHLLMSVPMTTETA